MLPFGIVLLSIAGLKSSTAQSCGSCPEYCDYEIGSGEYSADFCRYPDTGCRPGNGYADGGCCYPSPTPIIVDLSGDGFSLTDAENGVNFDLNSDGIAERIAWTSAQSDDAWLVLDHNNNGTIDNGLELFSNFAPQSHVPGVPPNGFLALAEYDKPENGGNADGVIDKNDTIFPQLKLWHDANHDGKSQPNELVSLASVGIIGFELNYRESRYVDQYGNAFRYRAKIITEKHDVGKWAVDVLLVQAQ